MVTLPGYNLINKLYESSRTLVYRGEREQDKVAVAIKLLNVEHPTLRDLLQYQNNYTIAKNLNNLPTVIQVYSLEVYRNGFAIVMEFGGISLKQEMERWENGGMGRTADGLLEFLKIAIISTQILEGLSDNRVIHKDIKPEHILINPKTSKVKLIDFGISSLLPKEKQEIQSPEVLEGTLAYMSPEQTGRMNRGIDYRTDFYSLGVTFYEMLIGQLPFQSIDPMELVHCQIARSPIPPVTFNANIPQVVNDIVLKLMAKTAEDRYQSAFGLRHDLERCLQQYSTHGFIQNFALGEYDLSDRFQITEKLYGRETEVATLLAGFDRVSTGVTELMLVAGASGVGKTALVNEVHKPIVRTSGYFIKGKFDQFKRNIPFSALVQAFQNLMLQLLTESTARLEQWKKEILTVLGENGQVLTNIIPALEWIIGQPPPIPELEPSAAENRFNLLFQKLIRVFTTKEHPLVIFLDDLQWADLASLKLIQLLMTEDPSKSPNLPQHLLLIGAYRDREVSPSHPLTLTLQEIRQTRDEGLNTCPAINQITLKPLDKTSLNSLIVDTLSCSPSRAIPLTEQVFQKTQGNPFFSIQFLQFLYQDGLIAFDFICRCWQSDIARVKVLSVSSDVVDFMADQLRKLPETTQESLKLAACIGNQFDLATLGIVQEKSQIEAAVDLWRALQEGLIIPTTEIYKFYQAQEDWESHYAPQITTSHTLVPTYKFLHDRVQQAAYSLILEDQRQSTHLKIGQLFLQKIQAEEEREARIFEIVNQLNIGVGLITHSAQRHEIAQLNLVAGRKARESTAYDAAAGYLRVGIELLPINSWHTQYDLTIAIYEIAAEVAYLSGNFEEMERFVEVVLQQARTLLDKIKVYEIKIQTYAAQSKPLESVLTALKVLQLLGVRFPKKPGKLQILLALMKTKLTLAGKCIEDLLDLPIMTEPYQLAVMRVMRSVGSPAYNAVPNLVPLLALKGVSLSLTYGNTSDSTYGYASYAVILCGVLGEIDTGYRFGQLALRLLSRLNAKVFKARTVFVFYCFVNHWKQHVRQGLQPLLDAYQTGLETGDLEFAAYSIYIRCYQSYLVGRELRELEQEMLTYTHAFSQFKQDTALQLLGLYRQVVLNLSGRAEVPWCLVGESYNEEAMLPLAQKTSHRTAIFDIYFQKLVLCYLFGQYLQAVQYADIAVEYLDAAIASLSVSPFHFYDSLACLSVYTSVRKSEQKRLMKKVVANQRKMKKWAHHAPMNHLHKFYLVEAERCRVLGQHLEAMDNYDRAIAKAKEHKYVNEESLANELAAKFYLSCGRKTIAQIYLTHAYYGYARWGAIAKVEDLEKRYPDLLATILTQSKISLDSSEAITNLTHAIFSNSSSVSHTLDLTTVLKASQVLSSEIQLDNLLFTLMQVMMENAGADKFAFILVKEQNLVIEAISELGQMKTATPITLLPSIPVESSQQISLSAINYVSRTLKTLVIDDATTETLLASDTYIQQQQPKSLLCTPIIKQGKLIGVLYLENNLTTGAFTRERLQILQILTAQAAISLENAQLYANLKQANEKLTAERQRYQDLFEFAPEAYLLTDINGVIQEANDAAATLFNISHEFLIGKPLIIFVAQSERYAFDQYLEQLQQKNQIVEWEMQCQSRQNVVFDAAITALSIHDNKKQPIALRISIRNVTFKKQAEAKLRVLAFYDPLTGLPNRTLFMDRLQQAMTKVTRQNDSLLAVLYLDLDRFKMINDSLGHTFGDQVLMTIAHRLVTCLRPTDTVARLGGDEFTILMERIDRIGDATEVAECLQAQVSLPIVIGNQQIFTTASIGVALNLNGNCQAENLLRNADIAMYRAKSLGKAHYEIFDTQMHIQAVERLQLENDLHLAMERQEFEVYYQPIVALKSLSITGFEALIRWQHPRRGLLLPSEFLAVAAEIGLIIALDLWVLRQACDQMHQWQLAKPDHPSLTIAVNFSSQHFVQSHTFAKISQILQETHLPAQSLNIEITEDTFIEDGEFVIKLLRELQAFGIKLLIDDFGTGYSSLSRLRSFPINVLKIDRTFIYQTRTNFKDVDILKAIIMLADSLDMDVIAEGVETFEQLAQLRELNCEYGQGYFFSEPLDSKATENLILSHSSL